MLLGGSYIRMFCHGNDDKIKIMDQKYIMDGLKQPDVIKQPEV